MKTKISIAFLLALMLLSSGFTAAQNDPTPAEQAVKVVQALRIGTPQGADEAVRLCNPKEQGYYQCAAVRGIAYGIKKDVRKAVTELQLTQMDQGSKESVLSGPFYGPLYPLIQQHVKPYHDYLEGNWSWKEPAAAEAKYRSAVAAVPEFYKAWKGLSGVHVRAKNYPAALETINKAILTVPPLTEHTYGRHDIQYLFDRADVYIEMADEPSKAKALTDVRKAMAMGGNTYEKQGKLYLFELGASAEKPKVKDIRDHCSKRKVAMAAIACFNQAIKQLPDDQQDTGDQPAFITAIEKLQMKKRYLHLARAELFQKNKEWAAAAADFETYIKLADKEEPSGVGVGAEVMWDAGVSFHGAKRYDAAIELMSRLLKKRPGDANAFYLRGKSKWALKLLDPALADYSAAIKITPHLTFWVDRAHLLMEKGDNKAAILDLKEVVKLDPTNEDAKKHLAELGATP